MIRSHSQQEEEAFRAAPRLGPAPPKGPAAKRQRDMNEFPRRFGPALVILAVLGYMAYVDTALVQRILRYGTARSAGASWKRVRGTGPGSKPPSLATTLNAACPENPSV